MKKILLKPLSVNEAWKGRRYKTDKYKSYEVALLFLLPNDIVVPEGKLELRLRFGFSSKNADVDNPTKVFIDVLQRKFGFNDKRIYRLVQEKVDVKKRNEFIEFQIKKYEKHN